MLTLLTRPTSFGSSAVPLPSLIFPPSISSNWSTHGISTAAAMLRASSSLWCGKLRPVGTLLGASIEGVHAPAICLTNRPGSWRQLKAWWHRKVVSSQRECTSAVSESESSGKSLQRVPSWFRGVWKRNPSMVKELAPLSPVGRIILASSELVLPRKSCVKLFNSSALPHRTPLRSSSPAKVMGRIGNLTAHLRGGAHVVHPPALPVSSLCRGIFGPRKPAGPALKPCLTLRPCKPKRSVRFAKRKLVQEYTPWITKEDEPFDYPELVGSPYERTVTIVRISKLSMAVPCRDWIKDIGWECNMLDWKKAKWQRGAPNEDEVDADGDVDMDREVDADGDIIMDF